MERNTEREIAKLAQRAEDLAIRFTDHSPRFASSQHQDLEAEAGRSGFTKDLEAWLRQADAHDLVAFRELLSWSSEWMAATVVERAVAMGDKDGARLCLKEIMSYPEKLLENPHVSSDTLDMAAQAIISAHCRGEMGHEWVRVFMVGMDERGFSLNERQRKEIIAAANKAFLTGNSNIKATLAWIPQAVAIDDVRHFIAGVGSFPSPHILARLIASSQGVLFTKLVKDALSWPPERRLDTELGLCTQWNLKGAGAQILVQLTQNADARVRLEGLRLIALSREGLKTKQSGAQRAL